LFKLLTGKDIGHLQTGLILSQVGGIIMIFMGLMVLWPSRLMIFDDIGGFVWIILGLGIIRVLAPILAGKGSKIVFWIVVALSVLKLIESFLATVGDPKESLGWYWYLILTGGIEVGVLIHLLNPKARAELSNQ
tara:strand:+ start:30 stop:431 length:402 start_codon:yes stop_codon:yes gene_type:complete